MKKLKLLAVSAAAVSFLAACSEGGDPNAEKEARNTETINAINQAWMDGDSEALLSHLADSYTNHTPDEMFPTTGDHKQDIVEMMKAIHESSPDMTWVSHHVIANGDMVAVFGTVKGTNTGAMMGMPATNRPFEANGTDFYKFNEDGKVTDYWGLFDEMTMMTQIFPQMAAMMAPPGDGMTEDMGEAETDETTEEEE